MQWKSILTGTMLTFSAVSHAEPVDSYLSYSSVANARHSSDFLYGERHVLRYRDGQLAERVVLYVCRNGSAFARKTVAYSSRLVPDFLFEDTRSGMREGIRRRPDSAADPKGRTVFYQERTSDKEKSGPVPTVEGLVADAGFDEFVQMHWDALAAGKALEMRFLLPSRLQDYAFQVQRLRSENVRGTATEVFRLRLAGIWGWFLPGIDVNYSSADHVLMRYDGLSDLHDSSGNNYRTTIEFRREDRHDAGPDAMRDARQAPVAPCQ